MPFDDPTYARKGESAAQRFDLFGSFLEAAPGVGPGPGPGAGFGPLAAAVVPPPDLCGRLLVLGANGRSYSDLLRVVRAEGHTAGAVVAAVNSLIAAGLVTLTDDALALTVAGRALLPPA